MTDISRTRVPDDVWQRAAEQFDEGELVNLLFAIAAINFWNGVAISARTTPASYGAVPDRKAA